MDSIPGVKLLCMQCVSYDRHHGCKKKQYPVHLHGDKSLLGAHPIFGCNIFCAGRWNAIGLLLPACRQVSLTSSSGALYSSCAANMASANYASYGTYERSIAMNACCNASSSGVGLVIGAGSGLHFSIFISW